MATIVTCQDRAGVAQTVARRLAAFVERRQIDPRHVVQLCLTGGRIANDVYGAIAHEEPCGIDWSRLALWWGDERFVPAGSPDRNAGQSLSVLARTIPLDRTRVHPMPSAGAGSDDLAGAAQHYASELGDTEFDLCLLGMGEDGHVASLFPGHPAFSPQTTRRVVGVTDSPKPPPERISLTLPVINASREVWLLVAGREKAAAAARAINGDATLPAGHVAGRERTVWFLDQEAAAEIADS
ncbi:6-phosphogluconolactonase [Granulicoccus sp. GXG6511]|uniref:6-phosphogluconolactonase n=1 Tax=Granulicoccus sp. GXG6511 TaxID=3381351 RepID=UPI003D7DB61A